MFQHAYFKIPNKKLNDFSKKKILTNRLLIRVGKVLINIKNPTKKNLAGQLWMN